MDLKLQHLHNHKLQMTWRASALRDADYNKKREEIERTKGNIALANMYALEYRNCIFWANKRLGIAEREKRLAGS
jgi:hypothetical protein